MGMFDRFIKTEERALENSNAPMSADDFLHIMGWGDFSSSAGVRVNVDNAIGVPAVWYAVAPQGSVVEEIDSVTYTFLLSNRDVDRFKDKHRGIFKVWDGFFNRGVKPSYKSLKELNLRTLEKKKPRTFWEERRGSRYHNIGRETQYSPVFVAARKMDQMTLRHIMQQPAAGTADAYCRSS
jgi:hypothetical protein